ncbi:MAG: ribosome recycling factor [Bacteroidota bacterium]
MTGEELDELFEFEQMEMDSSIDHLKSRLLTISTGKANPVLVSGIVVSYYGAPTPLKQVANVTVADSRTLVIQPWEKSTIEAIERAIFEANLGVTPQNDGELIRLSIPPLTEERRRQLVKQAKGLGEEAKVSIRSARQKLMDGVKKAVKDGYPEDTGKRKEDEAQKLTNAYTGKVDELFTNKEKDILTI